MAAASVGVGTAGGGDGGIGKQRHVECQGRLKIRGSVGGA